MAAIYDPENFAARRRGGKGCNGGQMVAQTLTRLAAIYLLLVMAMSKYV